MSTFKPEQLPNLGGRVALVTGGTSGLGLYTCLELAKHGARVYLTGRSRPAGTKAIEIIHGEAPSADVIFLDCELSDLTSVESCAKAFLEKETKLHILVNNAGIMAPPAGETKQGFETQFGVNYLSHFLLTRRLLPALQTAAAASKPGEVRVVNISSAGHTMAPEDGISFDDLSLNSSKGNLFTIYGQSKLANVLHSKEIAKRYGKGDHPIISVSLHPGIVKTGLARSAKEGNWWYHLAQPLIEFRAPDARRGAYTQLYCAASPAVKLTDNGCYYVPVGKKQEPSKLGRNTQLATKLWDWTDTQLAAKGFS
ncbi:hypothetical protein F5884DRAFT_706269 [Xylogone sp. PMI_703]|nr:hypothetical protein F5884DRAFT_706269 [Xylogone sp. PMI_703]